MHVRQVRAVPARLLFDYGLILHDFSEIRQCPEWLIFVLQIATFGSIIFLITLIPFAYMPMPIFPQLCSYALIFRFFTGYPFPSGNSASNFPTSADRWICFTSLCSKGRICSLIRCISALLNPKYNEAVRHTPNGLFTGKPALQLFYLFFPGDGGGRPLSLIHI